MFARYDYIASATLSQVIADIALLLTGTTNKASLSASCAQANTNIISSVAAGWSVYDAAAAANAQVFRALNGDGSTYKYMYVGLTTTTYDVRCYESWNAATHVGTNLASSNSSSSTSFSSASGGTIFLGASTQYAHLMGFVGTTFGAMKSIMERTRASVWDTTGNGIIPVVYSDGAWTFGTQYSGLYAANGTTGLNLTAPRSKSAAFTDVTGVNAAYTANTVFGNNFTGGLQQFAKSPDASGVPQYLSVDVFATAPFRGDLGGQLYGFKAVSSGGLTSDDVTIGLNTYFYIVSTQGSNSASFAIPKF
jgi:hypothetical protein